MNKYEPIRMMLRMAVERESIRRNEYITTMVRDAIVVQKSPEQIRSISRVTYSYSVALGRSSEHVIKGMTPESLSKEDIQKLLAFFESL